MTEISLLQISMSQNDEAKSGKIKESMLSRSLSEPECLTCHLTYKANETETEISLFLRKHSSVTGKKIKEIYGLAIYLFNCPLCQMESEPAKSP